MTLKLATVQTAKVAELPVLVTQIADAQGVIPLRALGFDVKTLLDFIKLGDEGLDELERKLHALPTGELIPSSQVKFLAPVPRPTSMRDGYAFRQHVEAARRNRGVPMIPEYDHFPVFYFTNHLAVLGSGPLKVREDALEKLDFELEVAIVTGKSGRNVTAADADEYIYGYMIMNDWSARALQMEEMKLNLGPAKGKDFATGLGPYLVPRRSLKSKLEKSPNGEKYNLVMKAFHNGKLVSESNLNTMNWTFAQILERVSYGVNIEPGEVIGSGTCGTGCYLELNGNPGATQVWIKPGDKLVLEVDELGRLENTIEKEEV